MHAHQGCLNGIIIFMFYVNLVSYVILCQYLFTEVVATL
jgi:hypothetical protein